MEKQFIRLNEEQLNKLITESVIKVISESEDEGLFNNLKSGIRGAISGNREAKFNASDVNTDYADANTNANNMANGVRSKEDAAKTYTKMINVAREYEQKADALMKKMRGVASSKGIDRTQNRNGGRFASGHQVTDTNGPSNLGPVADMSSAAKGVRGKTNAVAGANSGLATKWFGSQNESRDAELNRIIRESIYKVINESEDEGLKDMWNGFKQGYKSQRELDRKNWRYRNQQDKEVDNMFQGNRNMVQRIGDALYNKDASAGVQDLGAMAKQYREKAQVIRQKAKELAAKWGVGRVSPVGQTGPARYGYVQRNPATGTQTAGA